MTKKLLKATLIALAALLLPLSIATVNDRSARAQSVGPGASGQSPVYIPSVAFPLGTFTASSSFASATNSFSLQNQGTMYIRVAGTFTGLNAVVQITEAGPQVSNPTWQTIDVRSLNEGAFITNITQAGLYAVQTEGARQIRVNVTSATITGANTLTFTASGNLGDRTVGVLPERKRTFSAGNNTGNLMSAAGTVFTIFGNATTITKIKEISCSGTAAAAALGVVEIDKVSAAFTGGTPIAATVVPHSSTNVAGNATVNSYATVPTGGGTLVGPIRAQAVVFPLSTTPPSGLVDFRFSPVDDQEAILNSASEGLAVKISTAVTYNCFVEWTEN